MRQFDVFKNPNARTARDVPLLLLVQHSLLEVLDTRPVRTSSLGKPVENLDHQRDLVLAAIDVVLSGV